MAERANKSGNSRTMSTNRRDRCYEGKEHSSLIRVQHIKNTIGKADNAAELAKRTRQAVEEAQDRVSKHLEPHEIVPNVNKLETIPTRTGQSSRQATR